jgi:hypothetical protein
MVSAGGKMLRRVRPAQPEATADSGRFAEILERAEQEYDLFYDRYGIPLEAEHEGEFLAIHPNGQFTYGTDQEEVAERALRTFGPGGYLYKIGPRAVGKIR